MKKIILILILFVSLVLNSFSQSNDIMGDSLIKKLTSIDDEITKGFPRWKLCEKNLQKQVFAIFKYHGYDKDSIDEQDIEILAIPFSDGNLPFYEILELRCGKAIMKSNEIDIRMPEIKVFLTGERSYLTKVDNRDYLNNENIVNKKSELRDYCFVSLNQNVGTQKSEANIQLDYLYSESKKEVVVLSLFEQGMKLGDQGHQIRNLVGNDMIGYPLFNAGESKIFFKLPLYTNPNVSSSNYIRNLLTLNLGGVYRLSKGKESFVDNNLSFVSNSLLNSSPNGKIFAGIEFYFPFMTELGLNLDLDIPLRKVTTQAVKENTLAYYGSNDNIDISDEYTNKSLVGVAPILGTVGKLSFSYNYWFGGSSNENYLRFDVGMTYSEVQEVVYFDYGNKVATDSISGLQLYKNNEFADWIFLKTEYRNQSVYPFTLSVQYSNQILLARTYVPLFGNWLFLEAKYATPLRELRPYEVKNFFILSPVLRIAI